MLDYLGWVIEFEAAREVDSGRLRWWWSDIVIGERWCCWEADLES